MLILGMMTLIEGQEGVPFLFLTNPMLLFTAMLLFSSAYILFAMFLSLFFDQCTCEVDTSFPYAASHSRTLNHLVNTLLLFSFS